MDTRVVAAERSDQPALRNLFQLYAYDFSEMLRLDVEESGLFNHDAMDAYWEEALRRPFLIRTEERLAGFALLHRKSKLTGAEDVWDMAEFFVLRRYRRAGVGTAAAHELFARHPGKWEVRQQSANVRASAFWRGVISAFTGGRFTEELLDDERWRGPVQRFASDGGVG